MTCAPSVCNCPVRQHESGVRSQLLRSLGLSGVMLYVFVKEVMLKRAVLQSAFSPLGVISLLAAWPLFRDSVRHARLGEAAGRETSGLR